MARLLRQYFGGGARTDELRNAKPRFRICRLQLFGPEFLHLGSSTTAVAQNIPDSRFRIDLCCAFSLFLLLLSCEKILCLPLFMNLPDLQTNLQRLRPAPLPVQTFLYILIYDLPRTDPILPFPLSFSDNSSNFPLASPTFQPCQAAGCQPYQPKQGDHLCIKHVV